MNQKPVVPLGGAYVDVQAIRMHPLSRNKTKIVVKVGPLPAVECIANGSFTTSSAREFWERNSARFTKTGS